MTQKNNTGAYVKPGAGQAASVWAGYGENSWETALTHDAGSADPSSGAPVAWGAADVGRKWLDNTDPANPVWKVWQQLTTTPTYGWRTARTPKVKFLTAPQAVTFTTASPAAANVAWEDVALASLLNGAGVQDASQTDPLVRAVLLQIRVAAGASETLGATGADTCYWSMREKSSTIELNFHPQVADRYVDFYVWVGLDSAEKFQHRVTVGGGTPNFRYAAWVVAILESM